MLSSIQDAFPELIQSDEGSPWTAISARLLELYESKQTDSFGRIFDAVEHCIVFGNEQEREIVIVDLLEQIKNLCAIRDVDSTGFEYWLGPETYRAWRWLEKRWHGKTSLADETRKASK